MLSSVATIVLGRSYARHEAAAGSGGRVAAAGGGGLLQRRQPRQQPYESGAESRNTLYSAFVKRSPKYLDPASSYSNDETPYTYNVYETLYGYHYLKRPYELVPARPRASIRPFTWTSRGNTLPADAPGEQIAQSVYDIKLRPGMRYAPHPAFAKKSDGSYAYFPWRLLSCRTSTPSRIFR